MQRHDEIKPDVFDEEKIHVDTDASRVFSSMLESESSSPFTYSEDPSHGSNRGYDPIQKFEDRDMGLEPFSNPESNGVSIPTNDEDAFTESTEDASYITTKSDNFSLLHENNIMTESLSTEDAKSVSRKDSEIDDCDRTTSGREKLFIDQSPEMYNTETKNEKDMECEAKDRDVNLVEENGEDANEAEDIDSNANTWPEKCEEESLSLQENTDLVSATVTDKDQGNSYLGEKNSLVGQSVAVSATEHENESNTAEEESVLVSSQDSPQFPPESGTAYDHGQSVAVSATEHENESNTAEEESVLVSGQDSPQFPPESGTAYDHMITRQELLSNGPNALCEQSMLEQEQPCLPSLPSEEKDSLEGSDQNEKQQTHNETIELPFATNETDVVPHREGIEPGELPLATDEKSHTDEESPVVEKTDDAMREATDTGAGNGIQQYAETVESSFISNETNDMYKESPENVVLPSQIDEMEGVSNECFKAVEPLSVIGVTESLVMQTDSSSFETKSDVFDVEKILADTDTSSVLSSMLGSESSAPFPYVEDPSHGPNRGHDSMQEFEVYDTGLELFSTPESNIVSIPTDNEDFNAESIEDSSHFTTKSDTFSLLHENNNLTEFPEDAIFVSRKDEEIDEFDRPTIGREALFVNQSSEMHNAEAKNEKDMECEATEQDVNLVEENGKDANEAEDIGSNANTWPENCEEESLSLQVNTDLVSAIVIDKDQGNSNFGEENSPVGQSVTISATEHENQQSDSAEEEPVFVSGQDRPQTPPESGASYDHMITRQQLTSNGPDAICEQSMLEQEQTCPPFLPLGEKDSLEGSDLNEKQHTHIETVELSFSTNETELVPHREGIEPVELPLATDENSLTNDCDQLEESPVIEKTDDAMKEATDTAAGNVIQQYADSIESSVIINEMNDVYKEGSQNVILPSQFDVTEGVSNECFKAVEELCAIDDKKDGLVAEAPSEEQQPNEMIEERSAIEKLPEAVRDYQGQIKGVFLNGFEALPKSISLDERNVNDGPREDSSPTVQEGTRVNGDGIKAGEPDFVDKAAAYPNDTHTISIKKNEELAKAVSQTSDQGFEALRMDKDLTENILIPKQLNEEKLQLQIKEVMAKTASEMLPSSNFCEPLGSVAVEQFTSPTTEVPKNFSPTSSFGTSLTHRGQESQDLQTFEVDNKASTLVTEKGLNIHAEKRASIWDCCGFWNWLHTHED